MQTYNDQKKELILIQAPIIQQINQKFILTLYACTDLKLYLRDIIQTYVQSKTSLNRQFYIRLPLELKLKKNAILKILKFLYEVLEIGNHWFNTYHIHHIKKLLMKQSTYDSCLLFIFIDEKKFGIMNMQTDDTLIFFDKIFVRKKKEQLNKAKLFAKKKKINRD